MDMNTATLTDTAPVWAYSPESGLRSDGGGNGSPPNMAEIWFRAGQVPMERIIMRPTPGTATLDDAVKSKDTLNVSCELVDGILVAKTMGYFESKIALALAFFIQQYLEKHPIGEVAGADGPCETLPNHARKPDVSFTSFARIRSQSKPTRKALPFSPDLAVEVLSESNTSAEMEKKLNEYFATGARLVWYVEPELRTARAYTSVDQWEDIGPNGILRGHDVLPGFELSLVKLFERAAPQSEG
jgi:Uma2 family endonuclease